MDGEEQSSQQEPLNIVPEYWYGQILFLHIMTAHLLIRLAKYDEVPPTEVVDYVELEILARRSWETAFGIQLPPTLSGGIEDGVRHFKKLIETDLMGL